MFGNKENYIWILMLRNIKKRLRLNYFFVLIFSLLTYLKFRFSQKFASWSFP